MLAIKLASGFFFPKVIGMTKALPSLPPGWVQARIYHLLAPLGALAVVALLQNTDVAHLLEDGTVNLRFRARAAFDPPADPRVVFVGIDELSVDKLGKWVWPRYIEADFLKAIANAKIKPPHTLSFDIMFTEKSNKLDPLNAKSGDANDNALAEAIGLFPSVITPAYRVDEPKEENARLALEKRTRDDLANPGPTAPLPNIRGDINQIYGSNVADFPIPAIRSQSLFGFVNADPSKVDYIRHHIPLVVRVQDKVFPSLALQTLCQMLNVDPDKVQVDLPARVITLKNSSGKTWTIPTDENGEYFINYRRQSPPVSFYGLLQNLNDNATSGVPMAKDCDIENKTLIIGGSAEGLVDLGPTPLDAKSALPYVHINVIDNVLKNDYLSFVPMYWVVIGWSLVTWPTLLRLKDAPLGEAVLVPIALVVLYIVFAFGIFWLWSIQIMLAWPVISYGTVNFWGVVLRWREEQKGRQQIKQVFSQMLSPEVVSHLVDHPENIKMGGAKRAVTVLFSDIRDYTKFSEGLEEEELVRQLNLYFERMVNCVKECGGTLHKFIGDAIMAVWGDIASVSKGPEKDAQNAVRSALLMRHRLRELNDERHNLNLTPIRIGIGLNHGDVLVGLIGALSRSEFTVMGDAVNVASRLEGITKEFKTDLAISESVRQLIGDGFLCRRLGFIQLKGKSKATVVYEVLAETSEMAESKMSASGVAQYEAAFDHFLARRFAEAEAAFLACQQNYPDDYCVNQYLAASREFSANPPPPDWDGRIVMTTK
jgi:adenylate cyclase